RAGRVVGEPGAGALAGEAGEHQGVGRLAGGAGAQHAPVEGRVPVGRGEDLAEDRGVDDPGDELVVDGHADRDAEQRQPGGEVAGAVDRVDVEAHHRLRGGACGARGGRLGGTLPALLADDAGGGQQAAQLADDDVLAGTVVLGDDVVARGLVLAGQAVAVQAAQVLGGRVCGGEGDLQQVRGRGDGGGRGAGRSGVHRCQASPPWSAAGAVHTARTGRALPE